MQKLIATLLLAFLALVGSLQAEQPGDLNTVELEYSMFRVLGGEASFADFKAQPVMQWESLCDQLGYTIDDASLAELRINEQDSIIRLILMGSVLKANNVAFPELVNNIQKDYRQRSDRKKALEKALQGIDERIASVPIEEGTEIKVTVTTPSGEEVDAKAEVTPEPAQEESGSDE